MTARTRATLLAALAVALSTSALHPVLSGASWLVPVLGVVVTVALVSLAGQALRVPPVAQTVAGLLAVVVYTVLVVAPGSLSASGLAQGVPGSATVHAVRALLRSAGDDLAQYAPPAPPTRALELLVVAGVGAVAVAVDALAALARRPAVAGLPLLGLFAVPSALVAGRVGWLPFTLGAAGWLGLLLADERDAAGRWGPSARAVSAGARHADAAGTARVGRRVGGAALAMAVVLPALVPGLSGHLLTGNGDGDGSGASRSIITYNPITRLRGELNLPDPEPVLHYRTDDPQPDYLRMTTLGIYDGNGWRQDVLRGNLRHDGVDQPVPTPAGRSAALQTRTVTDTITIDELSAYWLPAPATPANVEVKGPWMWDLRSDSIFATRSTTSKVGTYTVKSSRALPDERLLTSGSDAPPSSVAPYATPVPATPAVRELTARIVRSAATPYAKAAALQAYFRNPANGFVYDERTATPSSASGLQDFLVDKRGFCEQYASAMAAMLRLAGVPSRVAVGFTPGTRQPDGSFVVTTDNAHAWPEAWIDGAGWVRFEPTPSRGGITPPDYSTKGAGPTAPAAGPGGATQPTAGASAAPLTAAERQERQQAASENHPAPHAATSRRAVRDLPLLVLVVAVAVVLVLLTPVLLRAARRRARWRSGSAEAAWAQLREDVMDAGVDWRDAESPRVATARLLALPGLASSAPVEAALHRLQGAVERERYAAPGQPVDAAGLKRDAGQVRQALRTRLPGWRRVRAAVLPRSTLLWMGSAIGGRVADLLDAVDRALAALGGRVRRRSA